MTVKHNLFFKGGRQSSLSPLGRWTTTFNEQQTRLNKDEDFFIWRINWSRKNVKN